MLPDAKKSLGQNFLIDENLCKKIVDAARLQGTELVIEIGPGTGALTRHLLKRAARVVAIELDERMLPFLPVHEQLTVIHADALKVNLGELARPAEPVSFVGNLPFYITSALLRAMLESGLNTTTIIATVQLEVAQRIVATPGDLSLLAVSVLFYGTPELLFKIPSSAFKPQPGVDSAVLRITPLAVPYSVAANDFFKVARAGFSQARKQLRNPLSAGLGLPKAQIDQILHEANIDPTRRAETLLIPEWVSLTSAWLAIEKAT